MSRSSNDVIDHFCTRRERPDAADPSSQILFLFSAFAFPNRRSVLPKDVNKVSGRLAHKTSETFWTLLGDEAPTSGGAEKHYQENVPQRVRSGAS